MDMEVEIEIKTGTNMDMQIKKDIERNGGIQTTHLEACT